MGDDGVDGFTGSYGRLTGFDFEHTYQEPQIGHIEEADVPQRSFEGYMAQREAALASWDEEDARRANERAEQQREQVRAYETKRCEMISNQDRAAAVAQKRAKHAMARLLPR